ncbi:MAG: phospholipase D family protein [Rhodospirillaceae bacterium]|jgi:phosphatidylserine/phosphatidylglycerophosphate/cardiolipin synthase-like enzyme|nr:phospholipase D family protein [Rhodospirillaceae bacterium]
MINFVKAIILSTIFLCFLISSANTITSEVEVGFSPNRYDTSNLKSPLDIILECIRETKKSILVATYIFTSKQISLALLEAHKRGVHIRIIADAKSNLGKYSSITFLANHGILVRTNAHYAIFHHKFMIFDDKHIETGSFNYSDAAFNKNAENILLLRNAQDIVMTYKQEWNRLWNESDKFKIAY